jgi:hypothetical protein
MRMMAARRVPGTASAARAATMKQGAVETLLKALIAALVEVMTKGGQDAAQAAQKPRVALA